MFCYQVQLCVARLLVAVISQRIVQVGSDVFNDSCQTTLTYFWSATSPTCPSDSFASGNVCRPASDLCDVPETCTGNSVICPGDNGTVRGTSYVCSSTSACRPFVQTCDGKRTKCPAPITGYTMKCVDTCYRCRVPMVDSVTPSGLIQGKSKTDQDWRIVNTLNSKQCVIGLGACSSWVELDPSTCLGTNACIRNICPNRKALSNVTSSSTSTPCNFECIHSHDGALKSDLCNPTVWADQPDWQ
jgi:hypothetical protein